MMKELSSEVGLNYRKKFEGETFNSVLEKKKGNGYTALTDNYLKIEVNADEKPELMSWENDKTWDTDLSGKLRLVKLLNVGKNRNRGIMVN